MWTRPLDLKGAHARLRQVGYYRPLPAALVVIGTAIWLYTDSMAFRQGAVITGAIVEEVHPAKYESKQEKTYGTVSYDVDGKVTRSRVLLQSCSPDHCSFQGETQIGSMVEIAYDPDEVTRVVPAADIETSLPFPPHIGLGIVGVLVLIAGTLNVVLALLRRGSARPAVDPPAAYRWTHGFTHTVRNTFVTQLSMVTPVNPRRPEACRRAKVDVAGELRSPYPR